MITNLITLHNYMVLMKYDTYTMIISTQDPAKAGTSLSHYINQKKIILLFNRCIDRSVKQTAPAYPSTKQQKLVKMQMCRIYATSVT
jgi:hypothetical protein